MIIDTHAHYDHKRFKKDRHELITALPAQGVQAVINVGCDYQSSRDSLIMALTYPHVYAAVGYHPHYTKVLEEDEGLLIKAMMLCVDLKVVAYGEIGLDFFHNFSPPDVQRYWFETQLYEAAGMDIPVIIHSRDDKGEVYKMIESSDIRKGTIHSFSGDAELALAYVELGFHIGIGGVVTFDKSGRLQKAVAETPLERILLETDCPYLTPAPNRGKRNDSAQLKYVAAEIAKIKGTTAEAVCAQTTENAEMLFGI